MKFHPNNIDDINSELVEYADKYIKKVLINAKKKYFRDIKRKDKIIILELDKFQTNLQYQENGFENLESICFFLEDEIVPIHNYRLAEALSNLTNLQFQVLLKMVLMGKSTAKLANEYGVSQRMILKHYHSALKKIRKEFKNEKK